MTHVPVSALRSAERWPVNLAPAASRRPMAFPTRVDAAIPGEREKCKSGRKQGRAWATGSLPMPNGMVFKTRRMNELD